MRATSFSVLAVLGSAWILAGCAAMESAPVAAPAPARIIVLYDAFGKNADDDQGLGLRRLGRDQRQAHFV